MSEIKTKDMLEAVTGCKDIEFYARDVTDEDIANGKARITKVKVYLEPNEAE